MPRLRNIRTGAAVSCSDETAARLGSEWVPADEEPAAVVEDKPRRKRTRASEAD